MRICTNCAASNVDASDFCAECGAALKRATPRPRLIATKPNLGGLARRGLGSTILPPAPAAKKSGGLKLPPPVAYPKAEASAERPPEMLLDAPQLARTMEANLSALSNLHEPHRADIMFVLDCTDSMVGELQAIKETMFSFVDTIESDGVSVRVGLVAFRDRLAGEEAQVLTFNGQVFTDDPKLFKRAVAPLKAWGGDDEPESSLDGILLALRQPFNPQSQKILVLITDAPPQIPDREAQSLEAVTQAIEAAGVSQFYLVIPVQERWNHLYLRLLGKTRGIAFDLGRGRSFSERAEHFKRTLMSLGKTISMVTK